MSKNVAIKVTMDFVQPKITN